MVLSCLFFLFCPLTNWVDQREREGVVILLFSYHSTSFVINDKECGWSSNPNRMEIIIQLWKYMLYRLKNSNSCSIIVHIIHSCCFHNCCHFVYIITHTELVTTLHACTRTARPLHHRQQHTTAGPPPWINQPHIIIYLASTTYYQKIKLQVNLINLFC